MPGQEKEPKIIGKINLETLNTKTRPAKKSKQEKKIEREQRSMNIRREHNRKMQEEKAKRNQNAFPTDMEMENTIKNIMQYAQETFDSKCKSIVAYFKHIFGNKFVH